MLELYHSPGSTCSQKVRLCLHEKNLPFTAIWINTQTNEHLSPEYLKLNPNGVVPTLKHDDEVVLDSSVICEYLDETFPEIPLSPEGAAGRAKMRSWMRFCEEVPTPAIRVPSFHLALSQRYKGFDEQRFRTQEIERRPLKKHFYQRMGLHGFDNEDVAKAIEQLDLTLERMEGRLEKGPWLMGEQFTIGDIIVAPTIDRMSDLRMSVMWEERYPRVTDWYRRLQQRPAFQQVYAKGARLSERLSIKDLSVPLPTAC
ncbi:MAG TPA: glutathione S-transferase family protein [Xanthobacteraceae bacterium]|nr:glutathione S-transferase family protein [Xanthobacteraceae bacterium]